MSDKKAVGTFINSLQELNLGNYLTFGYLYLIVLGIISEAIRFSMLGVNIVAYSEILDVVLSPISQIIELPVLLVVFVVFFLFTFVLIRLMHRKSLKKFPNMSESEKKMKAKEFKNGMGLLFMFMFFCLFLGANAGKGAAEKGLLQSASYKLTHKLTFADRHTEKVWLAGNNISFIFYASEGDKYLTVSPISSNITKIERLGE